MSDIFNLHVITSAGAALIAQATATNQIVFVDTKSCTLAATDGADLASKDISWYDGISGTIASASATDYVAEITVRYGNAGAQPQIVRSVCLRAKLANQADSNAVIIAAMSDAQSEIYLPSSASPTQIIRFMFRFAVNAGSQVETVYADGATIADLERFVSMHKAGDPTAGEAQTIKGDKTFSNDISAHDVTVNHDLDVTYDMAVMGASTFFSQIYAQDDLDVDGALTVDGAVSLPKFAPTHDNNARTLTLPVGQLAFVYTTAHRSVGYEFTVIRGTQDAEISKWDAINNEFVGSGDYLGDGDYRVIRGCINGTGTGGEIVVVRIS